ncbi:MAG: hypothetical protein N4A31_01600 [Rickettsiales bacterium]|jgi:hypothetical protein|nr:hypothetical protein [Rickettsiales bacterium]
MSDKCLSEFNEAHLAHHEAHLAHHHEENSTTSYMSEISNFFSTTEAQIGTFALTLGAAFIARPYINNALQTPQAKAAVGMFLTATGIFISFENVVKEEVHMHEDGNTCGVTCAVTEAFTGAHICGKCGDGGDL